MEKTLKKSIYLGTAALGLVAALGLGSVKADAATAKITSNAEIKTAGNDRNVNVTGSNAIYTKAGILKGARVVASKAKVAELHGSKLGSANLRAYRVATTSRGTVYYKVVSFDKKYRGWIYGGKQKMVFGGGLTSYDTTKDATVPSTTDTYKVSTTSSTANTTVFAQPAWTQYRVGRAKNQAGHVITSTAAYKDATFKLSKAVTTSREGDTWYQITDSSNADLNGTWIKSSDITHSNNDNTPIANNQVRVTFVNVDGGSPIGSYTATKLGSETTPMDTLNRISGAGHSLKDSTLNPDSPWYDLVPNLRGYSYDGLSAGQKSSNNAALDAVVYGGNVKVYVEKNQESQAFSQYLMMLSVPHTNSHFTGTGGLESAATITTQVIPSTTPGVISAITTPGRDDQQDQQALIESKDSTTKTPYSALYAKFAASVQGSKGQYVASEIPAAIKSAQLNDFYVVYDNTTHKLINVDQALPTNANNYQVWHYTYTSASGNLLAQTANKTNGYPQINFKVVAKNISIEQGDTTKPWSQLFDKGN